MITENQSRDIEITLCDISQQRRGGGQDVIICNMVEPEKVNRFTKKYNEAVNYHCQYLKAMKELQSLMEDELGKALILVGYDKVPQLEELANKYNINLAPPNMMDAI